MITHESLPFTVSDVNIKKIFEFNGTQYALRLRRNNNDNYFSMDVFDANDTFVYNSVLTYGCPFVTSKYANLPFQILPLDISQLFGNKDAQMEITDANLGVTVQLYTKISLT